MRSLTFLFAFLIISPLTAQNARDRTFPLAATISADTTAIILSWPMPDSGNILILSRLKGQPGNQWTQLGSANNSLLNTVNVTGITVGQTYEFMVQRQIGALTAFGYAHAAVLAPPPAARGRVMLWIDSSLISDLAAEIQRLRTDLIGDGWQVITRYAGPSATPPSIKAQIQADYQANYPGQQAVFLLGPIPVPYSGNSNWDGHPEHAGAWPADTYYADINGTWTDATVNNLSPARAANDNVPNDGKFDQSFIPSAAELAVGRVDFRRINAQAFGVSSQAALYKRYLDKDHQWRHGLYRAANKALVDDNFGFFSGEAFAVNGWRNAYPLVGDSAVESADFFGSTDGVPYLMAYGCGGGTYMSAGGVGNSNNFASDSVNAVFTMLFGSYHGDWDFETNPFMPAALASRGGILTCSWAGRPHWFMHYLASGETIGYCTRETMNAVYNNGFYPSSAESGAHISLLGDPTLRAHIVAPVHNLTALSNCDSIQLRWSASMDTAIAGYWVYKSTHFEGPYSQVTPSLVTDTAYLYLSALPETLYFQVKAVRRETVYGGGTYWNTSTGIISNPVSILSPSPLITVELPPLPCFDTCIVVDLSVFPISAQPVTLCAPGLYSLQVMNQITGCSTPVEVIIPPTPMLQINLTPDSIANCVEPVFVDLIVSSGTPPYNYQWSNGTSAPWAEFTPGADFSITVTDALGCMDSAAGNAPAIANLPIGLQLSAQDATGAGVTDGALFASYLGGTPPYSVAWSGNPTTQPVLQDTVYNVPPGTYTFVVTDANGCTAAGSVVVDFSSGVQHMTDPFWLTARPNPAVGELVITVSGARRNPEKLKVFNALGQCTGEWMWAAGADTTTLNVTNWPPGTYTLWVSGPTFVATRRLAVVR